MKKVLLLFFVYLISVTNVFAQDIVQYNTDVQKKLANPVVRGVTNICGCNLLAKKTAKVMIKKLLKKNADGEYDVKIDSFSAIDLNNGKFKSAEVIGTNIKFNDVYVSKATLKTLSNYNYIDFHSNPMIFYTDLPIAFMAEITEDDLNHTLIDMGYIKKLCDMNIAGISLFIVDNVEFKIKNNRIYLFAYMKAPLLMGARTIKVSFSGKLNIENGKIVFDNVKSENFKSIDMSKFISMLNDINPFNMDVKVFKDYDSTLKVEKVKIFDNKICINGIIVIKRS